MSEEQLIRWAFAAGAAVATFLGRKFLDQAWRTGTSVARDRYRTVRNKVDRRRRRRNASSLTVHRLRILSRYETFISDEDWAWATPAERKAWDEFCFRNHLYRFRDIGGTGDVYLVPMLTRPNYVAPFEKTRYDPTKLAV